MFLLGILFFGRRLLIGSDFTVVVWVLVLFVLELNFGVCILFVKF